ncbi:LysM domain-containing protein [Vagococcus xieshaowenii]|uniref:LysM domain-containing protein n=1 Tax=Vagococcus xieshaowenii TaxID=2562451 RepID=A0AAJ5EDN3_9ENTE|nr:LysM domain-containing protein [Vagococcus xieshaowenii]TFZ40481.1 LysM domain-containing protein [Vagococcus xieshaowenii]
MVNYVFKEEFFLDKNDNKREPWEEPIYDTESEDEYSRSGKKNNSKGNAGFITVLLALLIAIVLLIVFIFVQATRTPESSLKNEPGIAIQTTESSTKASASSTSEEASKTKETKTVDSESVAKEKEDKEKSEEEAAKAKEAQEQAEAERLAAEKQAQEEAARVQAEQEQQAAAEQQAAQQVEQNQAEQQVETPATPETAGAAGTYTVQPGEGIYRAAINAGVSMETLMQLNGLTQDSPLSAGQVLRTK